MCKLVSPLKQSLAMIPELMEGQCPAGRVRSKAKDYTSPLPNIRKSASRAQLLAPRCLHQNCLLAQMPGLPEFLKHAECFKECASTVHIWPHGNEKTWTLACCILLVGGYPYTDWYGPLNRSSFLNKNTEEKSTKWLTSQLRIIYA
ncbi:hypothetical protein Anapl_09323 [Anas platyrhynchos]|uniref:Uncharacterized protein n=1 Tax=Anas platyrhynchos TaxID=8839 RepID=R0LLQ3_ANAPL|nr:hypothetical protein Anapl_09323 [Anas platyrhynchos]